MITYHKNGSSFEPKAASLYSVALHQDGSLFTLGFSDPKSGEILNVEQYDIKELDNQTQIETLLSDSKVIRNLQSAIKNIYYVNTGKFTLIPSTFYDVNKLPELVGPLIEVADTDYLSANFIPEIDSYIAFTVPKSVRDLIKSKIGHTEFCHHFASLITTYRLYYTQENVCSVFIQYHQNKFSLGLFDGHQMVHFNAFDFKTFEDIIYYTYYTMEQFEFSPTDAVIHVGGSYTQSAAVLTTLQRYTKNIYHLQPNGCPNLDPNKSDAIINTIFDLQCG